MTSIKELKNTHSGEDIWIIAAGPSLNYIQNSFFENKTTIGVNRVGNYFRCDYVIAKDGRGFGNIKDSLTGSNTKIVLSQHESGNLWQQKNTLDIPHYVFEHPSKPGEAPNIDCIREQEDKLVVSYSTITSAIHLAAYLGAKNIILCGHDCGTIDNKSTIDGYYADIRPHQGTNEGYVNWLSEIENHTTSVCQALMDTYGVNIHSINPFINFNLEGHIYSPSKKTGQIFQRRF
jgi:hypothetical protein